MHREALTAAEVEAGPNRLRVTTVPRTVVDLAGCLPLTGALDLWAWVSTRSLMTVADLEHAAGEWRGRPGSRALGALLDVVRGGAVSGAEFTLHGLLRDARVGGWQANVTLRDRNGIIGVVDLFFAEARLVVEVDGFRAHSSRESFHNDRRRQNRLVAAGCTVLRFTWRDLTDRPRDVVRQIRRQLANVQV